MQKKYNDLHKKYCNAKDQGIDLEKKVEQVTKHLKENVLKLKVLGQEKDQAGAHFIMQEKNMQVKICNLQEEKNEIKVSLGTSVSLHVSPNRHPSGFSLIADESEKDAGGAWGVSEEAVGGRGRCGGEQTIPDGAGGGEGSPHQGRGRL